MCATAEGSDLVSAHAHVCICRGTKNRLEEPRQGFVAPSTQLTGRLQEEIAVNGTVVWFYIKGEAIDSVYDIRACMWQVVRSAWVAWLVRLELSRSVCREINSKVFLVSSKNVPKAVGAFNRYGDPVSEHLNSKRGLLFLGKGTGNTMRLNVCVSLCPSIPAAHQMHFNASCCTTSSQKWVHEPRLPLLVNDTHYIKYL